MTLGDKKKTEKKFLNYENIINNIIIKKKNNNENFKMKSKKNYYCREVKKKKEEILSNRLIMIDKWGHPEFGSNHLPNQNFQK